MATVVTTLPITMDIHQTFLRIIRKRTHLTQADLASIFKMADFSNISRFETGIKSPKLEILLAYHLLFDIPIEGIFERQKQELRAVILPRIQEHVAHLRTLPMDENLQERIDYLSKAAERLSH